MSKVELGVEGLGSPQFLYMSCIYKLTIAYVSQIHQEYFFNVPVDSNTQLELR